MISNFMIGNLYILIFMDGQGHQDRQLKVGKIIYFVLLA
jgi:hypothetical protein